MRRARLLERSDDVGHDLRGRSRDILQLFARLRVAAGKGERTRATQPWQERVHPARGAPAKALLGHGVAVEIERSPGCELVERVRLERVRFVLLEHAAGELVVLQDNGGDQYGKAEIEPLGAENARLVQEADGAMGRAVSAVAFEQVEPRRV